MITPNQEYRLGRKSLIVSSMKNVFIAIVIFIVALFLSAASKIFISTGNTLVNGFAQADSVNVLDITPFVFIGISMIFVLSFLIFVVGLLISWLSYQNFTFNFQEFDIKLKKGILNIEQTSIPYRQAQDVDVDRGIWYRFFGVSRLVITTAGHDESGGHEETEIVFDPVDKDIADEMQSMLQARIGVQVVEEEKS